MQMKTKLILKPGQKGTKKLCEKYGPSLVCVRYRYDTTGNKRYKTVELIEEETEWTPPVKENAEPTDEIVGIRVGYKETKLQGRLKKEGAKWDPRKKVWVLGLAKAEKMELRDRIVVRDLSDDQGG